VAERRHGPIRVAEQDLDLGRIGRGCGFVLNGGPLVVEEAATLWGCCRPGLNFCVPYSLAESGGAMNLLDWVASAVLFLWLLIDSVDSVLRTASRVGPSWLRSPASLLALAIPAITIAAIARLVYGGLVGQRPVGKRTMALRLALGALLLLALGYQIGFARVWDKATDGVHAASLALLVSLVGVGAAVIVELKLPKGRKAAARAFMLVVPIAAWIAVVAGGQVSPDALTERRAECIAGAVQRFHEQNGRYPSQLAELTPRYLWRIPEPIFIPGENWCYAGEDEAYRLGAVYRDPYHNAPATVRVYAAVGEPVDLVWECDAEAQRVKQ